MNIRRKVRQVLAIAACGLAANPVYAEVVVIVSAKSPVTALNSEEVAEIFLGKQSAYPNGADATPLDEPENSTARNQFYATVTGKTPALLKAYWSKLLFTGKGQPPREMANADTVKKLVANNVKFIGYVDKRTVDDSVKVVFVAK